MKMVFQEKLSYLINRLSRKLKLNIFPLNDDIYNYPIIEKQFDNVYSIRYRFNFSNANFAY